MRVRRLISRISNFFKTDSGVTFRNWARRLINIGILIWIVYQINDIGWLKVWKSLPTQPLFYLLFLCLFFQLPLFEVLIYRLTWTFDALRSIPIFTLKRVYNKDVLGYSGEIYFFAWAKNHLNKTGREVFNIIKDNNIISSITSTLFSAVLLAFFVYTDLINLQKWMTNLNSVYIGAGLVVLAVITFLFIKFRHQVISMPAKTAFQIFGIQNLRLLLAQFIRLMLFYVVLPDVPFHIWFIFIAVNIILARIPFIPSKDFIFAGIGISMAAPLAVSQDAVAGIMIALGAMNKIVGFIAFAVINLLEPQNIVSSPMSNTEMMDNFNTAQKKVNTERK